MKERISLRYPGQKREAGAVGVRPETLGKPLPTST